VFATLRSVSLFFLRYLDFVFKIGGQGTAATIPSCVVGPIKRGFFP
jgi:hypothetical protein